MRAPLGRDLIRGLLLLLMLEVAVRRLPLPKKGRKKRESTQSAVQISERFARLRATKEASRTKQVVQPQRKAKIERIKPQSQTPKPTASKPTTPTAKPKPTPEPESSQESTLARLKKARKRKG